MRELIDSDHASELPPHRSQTELIIFIISAPIYWFSKRHTSVETRSFGSKFIATK